MMIVLYSLALAVGLVLSSPWWLLRMATTQRYREGLRERLGAVPPRLRSVAAGRNVVWLHAVSVGEVLAASRLVSELGNELGEDWRVVISTTTRTGQALARERFGAERVFYFPLDFAWAVRPYLRALRPAALVLMESELWPRMLHECGRAGIPVAVVNARVSDRSFRRALRVKELWRRVLRQPSLWLAQSEEDARRLVEMGARGETVRVAGNLKYDVRAPKESKVADLIRKAAAGRKVLVGGSTVGENPPEDSALIHAQQSMGAAERPLLVLAPRHPENFDFIYSMVIEYPTLRATEMLAGKSSAEGFSVQLRAGERALVEIIVLDTIGDLAAVYGVADVAFLGGSLVRRGGHNPLEPAQFGVPVVMGPSFENFRSIVDTMQAAGAISIIGQEGDSSTRSKLSAWDVPSELAQALIEEVQRLLRDPSAARAMGERGRQVFEQQQGATARIVAAILGLVVSKPGAVA